MNDKLSHREENKKKNPFKVPPGYFEDFSASIMSKLPEKSETEAKVLSFRERMTPWLYMAAMFVGISLMVKMFVGSPAQSALRDHAGLNLTSSADIEEFYQYYEDQLTNKAYHEAVYLDGASAADLPEN